MKITITKFGINGKIIGGTGLQILVLAIKKLKYIG